jgi:hypothetical protein
MGLAFIVVAILSEVILVCSENDSGSAVDSGASNEAHSPSPPPGFNIHLSNTELSRGKQFLKVCDFPNSGLHMFGD